LFRIQNGRAAPIKAAPPKPNRLVGDRWALVDDGAIDLETGRKTGWPPSATILVAAMMADQRLVMIAQQGGKLELVVVAKGKVERAPIDVQPSAPAVGVVADKAGRVVVALADGTLPEPAASAWTIVRVADALAPAKAGPPPARSR
jgi:hypothetical protein